MTIQTIRKKATKLGHELTRFTTSQGSELYKVAWCRKCGEAFFSDAPRQIKVCRKAEDLPWMASTHIVNGM